jgi:hypothetical protein
MTRLILNLTTDSISIVNLKRAVNLAEIPVPKTSRLNINLTFAVKLKFQILKRENSAITEV